MRDAMKSVIKAVDPTQYTYDAKLVRVVDGDTVELDAYKEVVFEYDFGFHQKVKIDYHPTARLIFRLLGINAPEKRGETLEAAKRSQAALTMLLQSGKLTVTTGKQDKYGRWLAEILVAPEGNAQINASQWMLEGGFAVKYGG